MVLNFSSSDLIQTYCQLLNIQLFTHRFRYIAIYGIFTHLSNGSDMPNSFPIVDLTIVACSQEMLTLPEPLIDHLFLSYVFALPFVCSLSFVHGLSQVLPFSIVILILFIYFRYYTSPL